MSASVANAASAGASTAPRINATKSSHRATDAPLLALEELQEYHNNACRERSSFRQERLELSAKLKQSEHELWAEEQLGRDLTCRLETLETAIRRERLQYEEMMKSSQPPDRAEEAQTGSLGRGASEEPLPTQHEVQTLSAYLDRFSQSREKSCRSYLLERLRDAGLSAQFEGGARSSEVPATSSAAKAEVETLSTAEVFLRHWNTAEKAFASNEAKAVSWPQQTWCRQWTFRSHLDATRCVICDEDADVLISCGEDALVKGWNLGPLWRGAPPMEEPEPYVTLRGHTAAVFALAYRPKDRMLFSAGMDTSIQVWRLPESDSFSAYSASASNQQGTNRVGVLSGHKDSVWSLDGHPHLPYLASASADGCIAIWLAEEGESTDRDIFALESRLTSGSTDVPSCASWVPTDTTKVLGGYTSAKISLFDVRHSSQVFSFSPDADKPGVDRGVTSVSCHQLHQLAATGHIDNCARLVDLRSEKCVAALTDHSDTVTSVSIDPSKGHYLVTGCHDGLVRTFDLRTGRCCQNFALHEAKCSEAVHSVLLHRKLLASAGADGNVVVMIEK